MSENKECPTPEKHPMHMCQMKQQGLMEETDKASSTPKVVCNRCGSKANDAAYLCNPRPL